MTSATDARLRVNSAPGVIPRGVFAIFKPDMCDAMGAEDLREPPVICVAGRRDTRQSRGAPDGEPFRPALRRRASVR